MVEGLEVSGKTVEEAIEKALKQLGLTADEVEVTVLKKGKAGLLGFGADEARILVKPKAAPPQEEDKTKALKDIACEALSQILNIMGVKASVVLGEPYTHLTASLSLDIQGEEVGALIGRRGQTLSALQYILNLIVSHKVKSQNLIILDAAGYRKRRYENLKALALSLAEQVKKRGHSVYLEPMPPLERRLIHLALADDTEVSTRSEGQGESRKVVISRRNKT